MEAQLRLAVFVIVFALIAIWEIAASKRALSQPKGRRWVINLSIVVIDIIVQRVTLGALAFTAAIYAEARGWGLLHALDWPFWLKAVLGFLILDLAIYLQHVMSHALPAFWRLHQVHHADLDLDVTTALRFHPLEILISVIYRALVVIAFGIDPWVVVVFEAVLNGSALFTHGNVVMPARFERLMRFVFCTPDMHRVHHSSDPVETNSNYGFCLSIWDRALGTMRKAPRLGDQGVIIGLDYARDPARLGLGAILLMPFGRLPRRSAPGEAGLAGSASASPGAAER